MSRRKERKLDRVNEARESLRARLKRLLPSFIAILFFSCVLGIMGGLRTLDSVNEFMVTKVSRNILMIMGRATSSFPFSMYELFLYICIFAVALNIARIMIMLVKRRLIKALHVFMSVALTALIIANIYFVCAGFQYYRHGEYFPVYNPELTRSQTVMITEYFIDDFNAIAGELPRDSKGRAMMPYTKTELSTKIRAEYLRHTGYDLNDFTPKCKTLLFSPLMSEMHIAGVFFAPFGESNINGDMPAHQLPFTMAHETAHAKGVMREDDADQLALYICLTSDDPFIRYSAYSEMIYILMDAVWTYERLEGAEDKPEYTRLVAKLSPYIRIDWKESNDYWMRYNRLERINNIVDAIYNKYLQLMGQKEGTNAYIPPTTDVIEKPVEPGSGGSGGNPGGVPEVVLKPKFTIIQQIFFQAFKEANGEVDQVVQNDQE